MAHDPEKQAQRKQQIRATMHPNYESWFAATWQAQDGACYLCGKPLDKDVEPMDKAAIVIEHDHSHCATGRSCDLCRRGLAHRICNTVIGLAGDDPVLLRKMADALEAAMSAVAERVARADNEKEGEPDEQV
jgi:hypothetical protein